MGKGYSKKEILYERQEQQIEAFERSVLERKDEIVALLERQPRTADRIRDLLRPGRAVSPQYMMDELTWRLGLIEHEGRWYLRFWLDLDPIDLRQPFEHVPTKHPHLRRYIPGWLRTLGYSRDQAGWWHK